MDTQVEGEFYGWVLEFNAFLDSYLFFLKQGTSLRVAMASLELQMFHGC